MLLLTVLQSTLTTEQTESRAFVGFMLLLAAAGCWLLAKAFECEDHLASPESISDSGSVTDSPDSFFSPHI